MVLWDPDEIAVEKLNELLVQEAQFGPCVPSVGQRREEEWWSGEGRGRREEVSSCLV